MANWRDRLCGTVALKSATSDGSEEANASMTQIMNPSNIMSNGGAWYKSNENTANMKTFKENFVLPTDQYSVMLFNDEGTAIIYSETEGAGSGEADPNLEAMSPKYLN